MHVVFVTNGMSALASCHVALAGHLRSVGHRTTFVAARGRADRLAERGEAVVALDHDDRYAGRASGDPRPPLGRPLDLARWIRRRRTLRRASLDGTEILRTVQDLDPDLVVIDVEMHTAVIATATIDAPRVLAMSFFSIFRRPGLPPLNSSLGPATGPIGALRIRLAWARVRAGSIIFALRNRFGRAGLATAISPMRLDTVSPVDLGALARRHDVDLGATTDRRQWLRPFVARDLPILCYNAREMELPHEPPSRLHYVGPLIGLDRVEPTLAPADRERWTALVAARAAGGGRPLVYATMGTVWRDGADLLRRIVAVFENRPDWDLVLGLGGLDDSYPLDSLPSNVLALPWAPQLEVLAEADVAVTHGGTASLREAVAFGVPTVLLSVDVLDQDGNARRAVHHDLGVLRAPDATPEALEAAIETTLTDPRIAAGIDRMRAVVAAANDGRRAIEIVERLATGAGDRAGT